MKDIAICGIGGLAREVACLIKIINKHTPTWNFIVFFVNDLPKGTETKYGPVIGNDDDLNNWKSNLSVVIAIGSSKIVKKIVEGLNNQNLDFPNLIHPDFNIVDKDSFTIGKGNIIQRGCSVSCDVTIGDFNIFNSNVVMGHDDTIGSFNTFMPAVRLSGEVTIGELNFFGVGSIILQQKKIGNNVRIGAGSVLMTKPRDGYLYMGNPAKKVEI